MTEQTQLKRKIDAHAFAIWELHLFLDSHPNNCEAAKQLEKCQAEYEKLRVEYEEKYGKLNERSDETSRWQWISSPWPWETEAES